MRIFLVFLAFGLLSNGWAANPPVFPDQYTAHGVILLPYAELREPFAAYYDGQLNRSRIDYYGDLMITLQKSPAAEKHSESQTGAQYKIVWEGDDSGKAKRVCFKSESDEGEPVTPQNVIPSLDGFTRIGNVRCPIENIHEFREGSIRSKVKTLNNVKHGQFGKHQSCELWRRKDVVGEKSSTYSFWFKKDLKTGEPIPVTYEMSGYNSLLGSHYDHYIIHYTDFRDGLLSEEIFNINEHEKCGPFPGPGSDSKAQKLSFNPMKAYFDTSRRLYDESFDSFKDDHGKKYDTDFEHEQRKKIFLDNSRFISAMNTRNPSYKLAVNHLADKSEAELQVLRGRKVTLTKSNGGLPFKSKRLYSRENGNDSLPTNWDWRLLGAVNPVKDQAICGSCWSFGTTGTLEGVNFVKTGKLVSLSEQQLIDCSWIEGNNGCDGGEDFRVYNYMMKSGGLSLEEDYGHYLGVDGKCHANDVDKSRKIEISGFVNVTQYNVEDLKKALYENGPVTIAINAGVRTFSFYSNGIYDDPACLGDPNSLNHQVLLVGYGTLNGKDYWLVKNSWSTYWGNDGYILIAIKNNICGVTTMPTYPIIA